MRYAIWITLVSVMAAHAAPGGAQCTLTQPFLASAWPATDFTQCSVDLADVISGGPRRDGIPSIDHPMFASVASSQLGADEPVISLVIDQVARAYPLRILIWHEIVNDRVAGIPVAVTYCPLCNAALVFDRRVAGKTLEFGTTGLLRHSDMIMYDRGGDSWWQQYTGQAIAGAMTGQSLTLVANRLEPFADFAVRHPQGQVLIPNDPNARRYGANPYQGYDQSSRPFLYQGPLPAGVPPMQRVAVAGRTAVAWPDLQRAGVVERDGYRFEWQPGMRSALDTADLRAGRAVGSVQVTRAGVLVPHHVTFAFVWHAFNAEEGSD